DRRDPGARERRCRAGGRDPMTAGAAGRAAAPARAVATTLLIAAQLAVWVAIVFFYRDQEWLGDALLPRSLRRPRPVLSPLVHPYHLGVNLAILWLFGSSLERSIGTVRFLALYLGAAWFAGLMHWAVTIAAQADIDLDAAGAALGAVGSSGAVAGVLGAYAVRPA